LFYIPVAAPAGGIGMVGQLLVALGLLTNIGSHVSTYANRSQAQSTYQQQFS
jgi:hypothetical protein